MSPPPSVIDKQKVDIFMSLFKENDLNFIDLKFESEPFSVN